MPAAASIQFFTIWPACLALIWLPGVALARLLRLPKPGDWLLRSALEIGLGLSIWPLVLLWSTVIARQAAGPLWSPLSARLTVGALALAGLTALLYAAWRRPRSIGRDIARQWPWLLLFALLFVLAFLTRSRHIRDLVLPNWVDSLHHTMIVRLIVEQGRLPATYAPYIPDAGFSYHWGFHAWVAWVAWVLDVCDSFELARLLLLFGQVLNVLMLWMLYAAGRTLFSSRRAGFVTASLGMFVSWLPAYYTAWGRYTHLGGLLLAIPFLVCLWRLGRAQTRVPGWLAATAATGATLALTHVRVALFAGVAAGLLLVYLLARGERRVLWRWLAAALAAGALIAPWLVMLFAHPRVAGLALAASSVAPSWREALARVPWGLVWTPGMRELALLASAGLSELVAAARLLNGPVDGLIDGLAWAAAVWLLLIAGIRLWQVRRGHARPAWPWRPLALLAAWCVAVFALLNTDVLGLPMLNFLSFNAVAITLFLPVGLAAAGLAAWASGAVTPLRGQRLSAFVLAAALAGLGAANMRDIINPQTVLVTPADVPALYWIRQHTPPDARFAVNAWLWYGSTYAGSDAGYWIPVLTDRQSILPPVLYSLTLPRPAVEEINARLAAWSADPLLTDPAQLERLRADGVTHIFIGGRSSEAQAGMQAGAQAAALAQLPALELLYARDSVYIFRIKAPDQTALLPGAP